MTDEFDLNEKKFQDQNSVSVENNAKLDKNHASDEFLRSLEEIIGDSEKNAVEEPDSNIKADSEPKAYPEPKKKKTFKEEIRQDESDNESLQTPLQMIIARFKQFLTVNIRTVVSSVIAFIFFCMAALFFLLFSGGDQEKTEEKFADSVPVSEIKESDIALIENYEMKTFVIPMKDFAGDRVFLKSDFIIVVNKVDLIQLKNNSLKIREAVYNLFYNKNSEIILKKFKRSEQMYKLKNVLNLLFRNETIKDIEMANYKVV